MAKTKAGKKIIEVKEYKKKLKSGKNVVIKEHRRSTPD
tara:strand:+ start:927 stop:1040 length:114 start_codon:yes stop_codon:yes gene_type:complete